MPDSAVKRDPDSAVPSRRRRAAQATSSSADTEKKLARAARSAQRLAQLSDGARGGETLDLFADDAERAHLQALNTDIRQGTFEGFELPEVFLAAVQSNCGTASQGASGETRRAARESVAPVAPVQGLFPEEPTPPVKTGALAAVATRSASISTSVAPDSAPHSVAAIASALIASDRGDRTGSAPLAKPHAPELDRARATAFADTIDALYAVVAEQRTSTAAHARRMKTMLTIIVCVMLVTVATGIAQTAVLLHMSRDGKVQQDRMEQLMLNQQATLASLFDTDSSTVSLRLTHGMSDVPRDSDGTAPVQPVNASKRVSAPNQHAHHRAPSSAH
ncbi:hypothetical protein NK8_29410 [Caballeronia sp. NK8]|uniref:hypothetical protein n=1 Tax=Caballeronia sp. NK8 TaxID=140098 RepID=UPI001BB5E64D|nr:hypothetical protein [Caballeronia sp. NK8]BCQ24765.1 hypothetical protein NK8_29410 [Caballeronia sp. NK8]